MNGSHAVWPIGLGIVVRVGVWLVLPATRFASDEDSYYKAAQTLLTTGEQDLFWPPVTGWLIALASWGLHTTAIRWIRLLWIVMDLAAVVAVWTLARRIAPSVSRGDASRARRFTTVATAGYALYLPAISFAQFATSETPAVLLTLLTLVLVTRPNPSSRAFVGAGFLTGILALTRPNLLPLLVFIPAGLVLHDRSAARLRGAVMLAVVGFAVVGAAVLKNWWTEGEPTLARNSAYNLYIGNRDLYAEDLDLFSPAATPAQIEFRRQYFSGTLQYPTEAPEELQRQALAWIAAHPGQFARRALGRLARVFAPKTDVLELAGGEQGAGIFSPTSLGLLGLANVQWLVVLFGGLIGLAALWRLQPAVGTLFVAVFIGSLPLCLVAISKPRYAFAFEPLLLIGAAVLVTAPREALAATGRVGRLTLGLAGAFLIWGWTAWLIFATTSRLALAGTS